MKKENRDPDDENALENTLSLLQCNLVAYRTHYNPEAVSWAQYDVLEILRLSGPLIPSTLSEKLGVSRQHLSKSLRILKVQGLIAQTKSTTDGRALVTALTEEGARFLERAAQGRRSIANQVRTALTAAEHARLIELGHKVNQALEKSLQFLSAPHH